VFDSAPLDCRRDLVWVHFRRGTEDLIIRGGFNVYPRERLGGHKYPRRIEFVPALPLGPSGKILKRELVKTCRPDSRGGCGLVAAGSASPLPSMAPPWASPPAGV